MSVQFSPEKLPAFQEENMIAHPAVHSLSHTFSRTDLFLVVYVLVDTWMHQQYASSNLPRKRRGPGQGEGENREQDRERAHGRISRVRVASRVET